MCEGCTTGAVGRATSAGLILSLVTLTLACLISFESASEDLAEFSLDEDDDEAWPMASIVHLLSIPVEAEAEGDGDEGRFFLHPVGRHCPCALLRSLQVDRRLMR